MAMWLSMATWPWRTAARDAGSAFGRADVMGNVDGVTAAAGLAPVLADVAALLGPLVRHEEPLGPRTTYRVGGAARLFVDIGDDTVLDAVAAVVARTGVATLVVGQGSNLLVADAGFDGLALALGPAFAGVDVLPGGGARLGGAARLPMAARRLAAAGLSGFEWAVGVPGSVGGAVRMNAGGHGSDVAASLVAAEVVDLGTGDRARRSPADLALGYRRSALAAAHIVTWAEVALHPGDPAVATGLVDDIVAWRRRHQPGGTNAGSVFANPAPDSAGRLIDTAGGKGLRVGSAVVSTKHANFIQADRGGRADDVARLMAEVRRRVRLSGGPDLHAETVLVGFNDEVMASAGARPATRDRNDPGAHTVAGSTMASTMGDTGGVVADRGAAGRTG